MLKIVQQLNFRLPALLLLQNPHCGRRQHLSLHIESCLATSVYRPVCTPVHVSGLCLLAVCTSEHTVCLNKWSGHLVGYYASPSTHSSSLEK